MKLKTTQRILVAIKFKTAFPDGKKHLTGGVIGAAAKITRITAYRYLKEMTRLGLVNRESLPNHTGGVAPIIYVYALSPLGSEWLEAYKELF